jgi:hypothetical protein
MACKCDLKLDDKKFKLNIDLSNQIYNNLKNIIETSSEAKLFLNSVPCD